VSGSPTTVETTHLPVPQEATTSRDKQGVVMDGRKKDRVRLLIEEWLPIAEIGVESLRERTPMTPYPAPNRLHVWWARRPLVASRAAILCSLWPVSQDPAQVERDKSDILHMLGIHGDPMKAKERIADATLKGVRLGKNAYGYDRAFTYNLGSEELGRLREQSLKARMNGRALLDPMAGGGSIPFEGLRLGIEVIANDLNPVSWLVLKTTIEFPKTFGSKLADRYYDLGRAFVRRIRERMGRFFPPEPKPNCQPDGYLWARTIRCPYCGGKVPLAPNWKLDGEGKGVKLIPQTGDPANRHCEFLIVDKAKDQSPGTVKGGNAVCPFPDCGRYIDGDEIKTQAQAGEMGQQLYTVVYKEEVVVGMTKGKNPRPKVKSVRRFRPPRLEDDNEPCVRAALDEMMPEWLARDVIPTEQFEDCYRRNMRDCIDRYGFRTWQEFFSPRQLLGHATGVELFHDMVREITDDNTDVTELDRAAMTYLAFAIDKVLNWNAISTSWNVEAARLRSVFDRHDFSFKWSYGEMAATVAGIGYDWAVEETGKALEELIELAGGDADPSLFQTDTSLPTAITITNESADSLARPDGSIDCIVMDPPYYDNVQYAELSDFFYVWLKRTAGLLYPEMLAKFPGLTDKDQEAIANPFRFKDQKGAKELACRDYEDRMARIFERCRQVLKPTGVMTVMFTHKSSAAWDALATGIVRAGFVITASWPVNTEAAGSLHIKEKSAAKSTIFLVCRPREVAPADAEPVYWEEVEPKVVEKVRERVGEFQAAGIAGVDLYLACFGPALQVFSEFWPLNRGRAVQRANGRNGGKGRNDTQQSDDPYAVHPEDALDAARREVKRWRLEQLATVKRQHHLDPLSEWFVLAWDTFKAPRFSADEALRLARVVGLDFDRQARNVVCEVKGADVTLWDSKVRQGKGKLGQIGGSAMLDTLHQAALAGREQNTGAAQTLIEQAGLTDDPTLLTTLEVLLNVLPPPAAAKRAKKADPMLGGAASDFEALERLRQLAFGEKVPRPVQRDLFSTLDQASDEQDGKDGDHADAEAEE
jgi:adenine-specific DNA methylase